MKSTVTGKNMVLVAGADGSVSVEPSCRHREARAKYRRAARSKDTSADAARYVVNLRGWPGLEGWKAPAPSIGYRDRFGERNALYVFAAADAGVVPETFGLGAAILAAGLSTVAGAILVPDDLGERDPAGLEAIRVCVNANPLLTTGAPVPWQVLTLSRFFDPLATIGCGYLSFWPNAYTGSCFVVGADLGRFLGLVAEHSAPRKGKYTGSWDVWLPGCGTLGPKGNWRRASPHRPCLRLKSRRTGWQVEFGPCEKGFGKYLDGRLWRGAFIDELSLSYALDADRGASYGEHRVNLGLAPDELPLRIPVDGTGAAQVAATVLSIYEFALVLDEKAAEWFTTPQERTEGRGRLDLARTSSSGVIASKVLSRFKITAPLEKFDLTDAAHAAWAETSHGGQCWGDDRFFGTPFPAYSVDGTSFFPFVAHLNGWWDLLTAGHIDREDVTEYVTSLCELAALDATTLLDPVVWRQLGHTVVECYPDGPFPIEVEDEHRPDGRMEVPYVSSPERAMFYAVQDVVASAVLSGEMATRIIRATKLVPGGRQAGLRRRLPVLPGLVLDIEDDPATAFVHHRQKARPSNPVLAAELRVVVNALTFGIFGRFDETRWGTGTDSRVGEKPGPWTFMPVASSVTAGSHLLLAIFERLMHDHGGVVVYCDTDCWIVLVSPGGGTFVLPDGSTMKVLSWKEVDEIVALFDPLRVFGPDIPVWKCERGTADRPLHSVVFGPKKHAEFTIGPDGTPQLVEWTEANLGGTYADPSGMTGQSEDGSGRAWSHAAVVREVTYALARQRNPAVALKPWAPWDVGKTLSFPAFRPLTVVSPEVQRTLPIVLGAKPGTHFLEAVVDDLFGSHKGGAPVALDPGDDLAGWRDLGCFDRQSGKQVRVTTDPMVIDAVLLSTLGHKAAVWSRPPPYDPIDEVIVDPLLVQHRGRVSGIIDADIAGLPGDLRDQRPVYDEAKRADVASAWAKAFGPRRFARRAGVSVSASGRAALRGRISKVNVNRALRTLRIADSSTPTCPVDDRPVFRAGAMYCSPKCRATARKRRQRERAEETSQEDAAS